MGLSSARHCLAPVDLQFVLDRFNAVDATDELLGHLLLVERANGAFEANFVAVGSNVNLSRREAVAFAECSTNLGKERCFERCVVASGRGSERCFHCDCSLPLGVRKMENASGEGTEQERLVTWNSIGHQKAQVGPATGDRSGKIRKLTGMCWRYGLDPANKLVMRGSG